MNKFIARPLKICDFKNTAQAIVGYHNFGHPRGYFGEPLMCDPGPDISADFYSKKDATSESLSLSGMV